MEEKQSLSPHDCIVGMIDYLIATKVRRPPYIVLVSKRQLWFGNGLWKDCADPVIKAGLRKYLGVRIPSDKEIERSRLFYGYDALQKPNVFLNNITNNAIRQGISWKVIDDGEYSDIRPVFGKGYIRSDGTMDPSKTMGVSCYIFFKASLDAREIQNEWIRTQPDWVQLQILRNQFTHRSILAEKQKQASTIVKNNRKLLALSEYLELKTEVDREKIPWSLDSDDNGHEENGDDL